MRVPTLMFALWLAATCAITIGFAPAPRSATALGALSRLPGPAPAAPVPADFPGRSPADTVLVDSVQAGRLYITRLPANLAGRRVQKYQPVRIPAMGWIHGESFFWFVPETAQGDHSFGFTAATRENPEIPVTLTLFVLPR